MKEIIFKNKYRFISIFAAIFYQIICSMPNSNLVMFMAGLIFMIAITYTNIDFLLAIKSKSKSTYIFLITTTFTAFLFEAAHSASFYLSDMIIKNYYLSMLIFFIRFIYFFSSALTIYHLFDIGKKKYIFIPLLNMFFAICLYVEVIIYLIPKAYIFGVILLIIVEFMENKNEN
ncbi:hypothetical protein KX935_02120 [Streptobacillus moniliformis]|uniref:Uncharacterized protein n=1 Tax=Streptobacillus moniliformis (strain ATCC 14647 / DSM 12112 / NCTC 10651 / 9901) TaxID=519441 RepID=D1AYE6_STRM9|nr:hypothetical protein [Streptobacillus moniliformis]ACZ01322.1 hypothetical protein Smon_0854 [Streptobacillus moniliformis DSM 12112]AVL43656.1 hypothetical protein CEP89_07575 [Streptobacillus moniliformis]QXW66059.1 hypothetical protein KX935_02120 [Streptobacillus moniliformis]SQA13520.1 Uncharacterised protein [Streptobacillus moniliformis]